TPREDAASHVRGEQTALNVEVLIIERNRSLALPRHPRPLGCTALVTFACPAPGQARGVASAGFGAMGHEGGGDRNQRDDELEGEVASGSPPHALEKERDERPHCDRLPLGKRQELACATSEASRRRRTRSSGDSLSPTSAPRCNTNATRPPFGRP